MRTALSLVGGLAWVSPAVSRLAWLIQSGFVGFGEKSFYSTFLRLPVAACAGGAGHPVRTRRRKSRFSAVQGIPQTETVGACF